MNAQAKPQPKSAPRRSSKPQLQHWTEVQVTDPDTRPLGTFSVKIFIKTDEGSRAQTFKVRAPIGCSSTELRIEAIKTARMLGFTPISTFAEFVGLLVSLSFVGLPMAFGFAAVLANWGGKP